MRQRKFSIVVPDEMVQQLEFMVLAERKSRNALIRDAIKSMIAERGTKAKATIKAKLEEKGVL